MKTKKKKFSIEISGEFFCQGMEMTGNNPGKTLVVTAGVHGREYVGIQTLFTFAEDILCEEINGRLILIPVVNEEGFYQGSRQIVPADGINLNRAFPGNIHGTRTWRLAAALETCLYPKADFLLDLHGGDDNEMAMPFVYFSACAGTGVTEASRRAASSLSVSVRTASSARNGLYSQAAQRGIPSLLLERGGGGLWSAEEIKECKKNIRELMVHLGMIQEDEKGESKTWKNKRNIARKDKETEAGKEQREILHTEYLRFPADGIWYPSVIAGQYLNAGDIIGELYHMDGELIHRYKAKQAGIVLYYTTALGVRAGDSLAAIGKLESHLPLKDREGTP